MINIRETLYNESGAMSKKYFSVLCSMVNKNKFTCSEITKECHVSFKMITDLVNLFDNFTSKQGLFYSFNSDFANEIENEKDEVKVFNEKYVKQYELIVSKFKQDKSQLDHISATSETAIKRALYIYNHYDTKHCKIAMLGDHDFTSIALKIIDPNVELLVLDIDNDILKFIDDLEYSDLTTIYADFRVGIPLNVTSSCDLVFTDPPYTTDGMDIFLKNAKQLCKKSEKSAILCAYTCGDLVIKNGLNVQKIIVDNGLYIESLIPKFNLFNFAESLGYCSDLYTLRMTNLAYKENSLKLPLQWNIYTHGNFAIESSLTQNEHLENELTLQKKKLGVPLMDILRNNLNLNNVQKPDEIYFSSANLFSFNIAQILINLHTTNIKLKLDENFINKNLTELSYFFDITNNSQSANYNYEITINNKLGGIFAQKSYMKLESALVKYCSLKLGKTKNQMREIVESDKMVKKYKDFQIGAIPVHNIIKIIDKLNKMN